MPDPMARARHFRDRAVECEHLADLCSDEKFRGAYRILAERYIALAEAEEALAKCETAAE